MLGKKIRSRFDMCPDANFNSHLFNCVRTFRGGVV